MGYVCYLDLLGLKATLGMEASVLLNGKENKSAVHRSMFDILHDGALFFSASGDIVDCNHSAERILGVKRSQILGSQLKHHNWDTVHEDGSPFLHEEFPSSITLLTGDPQQNVVMGIKKTDGEHIWIKINSSPFILNENDDEVGVLSIFSDISAEKLFEQKLRQTWESLSSFKQAIDSSALISRSDTNGYIIEANDRLCAISGYGEEELIGEHTRIHSSNYHPRKFWQELWIKVLSGQTWRGEIRNRKKDGSYYWVDTTVYPIMQRGQIFEFISVHYDITERKRAEEKIKHQHKLLKKMAHFQSHRIRKPVASILGLTELLDTEEPVESLEIYYTHLRSCAKELDEIMRETADQLDKL